VDERTDEALLSAARSDPGAFGELYRRHVGRIVGFAAARCTTPDQVADLVASTFLVALERAGSFDPARGSALNWLFGIAARLAANQRRRHVREALANARFDARALLDEDDVERLVAQIEAASAASAVQHALRELPERHREVLLLVGSDELGSAAAGARAIGITQVAFRVRLVRARRALRAAMARHVAGADADPESAEPAPKAQLHLHQTVS